MKTLKFFLIGLLVTVSTITSYADEIVLLTVSGSAAQVLGVVANTEPFEGEVKLVKSIIAKVEYSNSCLVLDPSSLTTLVSVRNSIARVTIGEVPNEKEASKICPAVYSPEVVSYRINLDIPVSELEVNGIEVEL